MGEAIGEILPLALGVAISPVPIIAVILMLLSPRAGASSTAFTAGWVLGVAVVVTVVAFVVNPAASDDTSKPSVTVSVIKLVSGSPPSGSASRSGEHVPPPVILKSCPRGWPPSTA